MVFSRVLVGFSLRKRAIHPVKGDDDHKTHCIPPMRTNGRNHVIFTISTVWGEASPGVIRFDKSFKSFLSSSMLGFLNTFTTFAISKCP